MAISIKKSSMDNETVTSQTSLSSETVNQIQSNTKLDTTDYTKLNEVIPVSVEKGKRTDDLVQLKFSKGKRAESKAFFATYDLKMNTGFEIAYEFLKEEVNAGHIKLSRSGVQRISK